MFLGFLFCFFRYRFFFFFFFNFLIFVPLVNVRACVKLFKYIFCFLFFKFVFCYIMRVDLSYFTVFDVVVSDFRLSFHSDLFLRYSLGEK